jgi:hypothetical protein
MRPAQPINAPSSQDVALSRVRDFQPEDCNLVLSVEIGQEPDSAKKTLVAWYENCPLVTEMLDAQVGVIFQRVPYTKLNDHFVYKSNRGWVWWYWQDTRKEINHSGWYLSSEVWLHMSKELEVIVT